MDDKSPPHQSITHGCCIGGFLGMKNTRIVSLPSPERNVLYVYVSAHVVGAIAQRTTPRSVDCQKRLQHWSAKTELRYYPSLRTLFLRSLQLFEMQNNHSVGVRPGEFSRGPGLSGISSLGHGAGLDVSLARIDWWWWR